jgi:ATP-dependent Clp protease adaptor protein ClpS
MRSRIAGRASLGSFGGTSIADTGSQYDGFRWKDASVTVAPAETVIPEVVEQTDKPWVTIVWNDPVNLMSYVTYVFMAYFHYDRTKAESLMLDVHEKGRATVSNGSREEMERDVTAMHGYGLWATMQKDS